jgi:hypothetical protein
LENKAILKGYKKPQIDECLKVCCESCESGRR